MGTSDDSRTEDADGGAPPRPSRSWLGLPPLSYVMTAGFVIMFVWGVSQIIAGQIDVIFLAFLGILIAAILNYPVTLLSRLLPRSVAAVLTLLLVLGVILLLVYLTIPILTEQGQHLFERAPTAIDRIEEWWRDFRAGAAMDLPNATSVKESLAGLWSERFGDLAAASMKVLTGFVSAVSGIFLLLILAAFLAYEPSSYRDGMVWLAPARYESTLRTLFHRLGETIQGWMLGTLISMTVIGTVTAFGLWLVGVDSWFVLGVLAFFGEFVPFVGPVLAAVPGLAIALAESPTTALYALLVYVGIQQLEGSLLTPVVMKKTVTLNPGLLLVWQLILSRAFGFTGLMIATPLLACIKVTIEYLYVERMLGKSPPGEAITEEKEA